MSTYYRLLRAVRRNEIRLRSKWKFDFVYSTHERSKMIHFLDHGRHDQYLARTPVTFLPHANDCKGDFAFTVYLCCGSKLSPKTMRGITLGQANELVRLGLRSWCKACERATEGKWILDAEGNRTPKNS